MKLPFLKYRTEEFNIPDWISFYRIFMAPIVFLLMFITNEFVFALFLGISLFSDAIDGFLARRWKIASTRGAYLDSIGDVMTVITAIVGIFWYEFDFIKAQTVLISLGIGIYLLQLGLAYWRYGKPSSFHTYSVKVAAVLQAFFFLILFFHGYTAWLFYAMIFMTYFEATEEIILIFVLPKWETDVKGLYWVLRRKKKK